MLTHFLRDKKASVAPFLALAIVPIMGFTGAAVDYSRASSVRTAMQGALDSTGLMLSKDAASLSADAMTAKMNGYFNALFNSPEANNVSVSYQFSAPQQGSFSLKLTGTASVNTVFTNLLGLSQINFSATSEILWGMKRLEIALVLDNTGSMANGGKIVELKKAVLKLLETLQKAGKNPDDVKVAIIPFDTTVRVDQDHKSAAAWVDFDNQWEKNTWIGCLEDRTQNNDVSDTPPNPGSNTTSYPATQCSNNGALVKMRPLTNDWQALKLTTEAMNPNGNTNITIGLVWGWHALTPSLPFTEASSSQPDLDKVIILLTDGKNTQNRWTTSPTAIDARTQKACDNIKAANIRIYTVRVIDGNADLLRNCATKPDMFYDVDQASELNGVFSSIAQNLANLRIAK
ncbi:MAG: VWA domain-containing protein [Rhizobiales bacterium]|nr:VWA domain-containing protein [Hyphomicrobiales bacterium]